MRAELVKLIEDEYPFMRRNHISESNLYKKYGLAIGDGWYDIINEMCREITEVYKQEEVIPDLVPVQAKEKFGKLRFYYDVGDQKKAIHAFDFLGSGTIRLKDGSSDLYKKIAVVVTKYEEKSSGVCEICGHKGEVRSDLRWIKTLCNECYKERIQK